MYKIRENIFREFGRIPTRMALIGTPRSIYLFSGFKSLTLYLVLENELILFKMVRISPLSVNFPHKPVGRGIEHEYI